MINLWKSSYIFINIKCSYRNWHKIVKTVSSLQFHMFPLLTGWEPYIQTMQQVRSTGQIFFSNRAPVDLNTYIYIYRCTIWRLSVLLSCLYSWQYIYIYHHIPYTYIQWLFPISKLNSKSTYVFKQSLNLGSLQLEIESHHQIASAQVVCLTGRQNLPKSKAAIGKTTSRSWKKHTKCKSFLG